MAKTVVTPIGILCFADQLFKPKPPAEGKPPRYSGMLLFDSMAVKSTAYQDLRLAIQEAAADKFGAAKANDPAFMRSLRLPLRPASEKSYAGFEKGEIFIAPWSDARPGIVDIRGNEMHGAEADVFSGQLARFTVRPFGYDNSGNRGVALGLEHVQIVKQDMPRIDGRRAADQAFKSESFDDEQMRALGIDPNASNAGSSDGMPW